MTTRDLLAHLQALPEAALDLPVYVWDDWLDFPLAAVQLQLPERSATLDLGRPARVVLYSTVSSGRGDEGREGKETR